MLIIFGSLLLYLFRLPSPRYGLPLLGLLSLQLRLFLTDFTRKRLDGGFGGGVDSLDLHLQLLRAALQDKEAGRRGPRQRAGGCRPRLAHCMGCGITAGAASKEGVREEEGRRGVQMTTTTPDPTPPAS